MQKFDIEKYLKDVRCKQSSRYENSLIASIDTEALFTDRNLENIICKFSKSEFAIREVQKPYKVEDYFPKPQVLKKVSGLKIMKEEKENQGDEGSTVKDTFRNPMISIENRTSRSPSPNLTHERRSTADFFQNSLEVQCKKSGTVHVSRSGPRNSSKITQEKGVNTEKMIENLEIPCKTLTLCTCILAGSLFSHKADCKKVQVAIGRIYKRLSVVEACVKLQRAIREFLKRKKLSSLLLDSDFLLFSTPYKQKEVQNSVLSLYDSFFAERYSDFKDGTSKLNSEGSEILGKMLITSSILKNCRSDFEDTVDFELSGTFK